MTVNYTDNSYYNIAAYLEEDGGHENSGSSLGGSGSSSPNGTMNETFPSSITAL